MKNEIKNSEDFIDKKIGKDTGFSIPSNYFDNLEDAISLKISEENFNSKSGFKTPNNYFNTIENSILSKVKSTEKEIKVFSFKERVLKIIPYAAAACVLLFIGLNSFNTNKKITFDSLNDNDYEYWLNTNTLSSSDVSIVLYSDILDENDFSLTNIDDEIIEDYMYNIDNSLILDEID